LSSKRRYEKKHSVLNDWKIP
jgi:hypothetical protein